MVPRQETNSYHNRYGIISQNVLVACNFDLEFIYVLSEWEGSIHDSKMLNDTLSRNNGLKVLQSIILSNWLLCFFFTILIHFIIFTIYFIFLLGKYFLVDCGFPNQRNFLTHFQGVCYHLQDFHGHGHHPENVNELNNLCHVSLRNIIERLFGILKSRFTIFKKAHSFPYNTQGELVLVYVGFHNFIRNECCLDEFPMITKFHCLHMH